MQREEFQKYITKMKKSNVSLKFRSKRYIDVGIRDIIQEDYINSLKLQQYTNKFFREHKKNIQLAYYLPTNLLKIKIQMRKKTLEDDKQNNLKEGYGIYSNQQKNIEQGSNKSFKNFKEIPQTLNCFMNNSQNSKVKISKSRALQLYSELVKTTKTQESNTVIQKKKVKKNKNFSIKRIHLTTKEMNQRNVERSKNKKCRKVKNNEQKQQKSNQTFNINPWQIQDVQIYE